MGVDRDAGTPPDLWYRPPWPDTRSASAAGRAEIPVETALLGCADIPPEGWGDQVECIRNRKRRRIASPTMAGAMSQKRRPKASGHGKTTRLTRRVARSALNRNGVGPSNRSVIGEANKPGQITVTPMPCGSRRARSASAYARSPALLAHSSRGCKAARDRRRATTRRRCGRAHESRKVQGEARSC